MNIFEIYRDFVEWRKWRKLHANSMFVKCPHCGVQHEVKIKERRPGGETIFYCYGCGRYQCVHRAA